MFLKGCEAYGVKAQDLFQVNDLYENKNLYMIVDNLFLLGGHVSKIKDLQLTKTFYIAQKEQRY